MDRAVLVALVVSRFLKKSYSFTAHAADIYTKVTNVQQKIDNASFVITVSKYNKLHLINHFPGIDAGKIHILHPWVDVSQFIPSANRQVHDRLQILSVGRLVEKKGHIDLIDAVYFLREKGYLADCLIVGGGPLQAELEERISERALQNQVRLLGGQPQEKVMELLNGWADVFVLPCIIAKNGDRDGIPVSIAEAMAMELPVISTDIVGIRELVQEGTGFLVNPHDPMALSEALLKLAMQDQVTMTRMGRKGREVVEKEFNLLKGTQVLAEYFCEAVRRGSVTGEEKVKYVSG
jgi:glycosyltransferase involved in cell wall biosynthesis